MMAVRGVLRLMCAAATAAFVFTGPAPVLAGEAAPVASPAPSPGPPVRQLFDVQSTMRDGTRLSADVWMPDDGEKHPVILVRTPYLKTQAEMGFAATARYFAQHGYAYVVQDVRGRGDSEGEFDFFFQEAHDGYDAIEAIAAQPWSNGRGCTMGSSS